MIHPSYSELIEAINTNNEDDDESMVLNSRYSLVLATSKRARQLIAGSKPLVEGAIKGLFFQGDDSKYTDACVYLSNIAGNSNTVAVFQTKNSNDVKASLQTYLESAEANAQEYFGEEVNKIKNALLDSNDKYVVLVIADDMEQAKNIVEKILK